MSSAHTLVAVHILRGRPLVDSWSACLIHVSFSIQSLSGMGRSRRVDRKDAMLIILVEFGQIARGLEKRGWKEESNGY